MNADQGPTLGASRQQGRVNQSTDCQHVYADIEHLDTNTRTHQEMR